MSWSRWRLSPLVLVVGLVAGLAGGSPRPTGPPRADRLGGPAPAAEQVTPERLVREFTDGWSARDPYQESTGPEGSKAAQAFGEVLAGRPAEFTALGYAARGYTDPAGRRTYTLLSPPGDRRGWPFLLAYPGVVPAVLIEAPHPRADRSTELLAARLASTTPGAALLVAGAHRDASDGRADVAHAPDSMFHRLAARAAAVKLPQVQVHGYADDSLPRYDAVVSTGVATDPDRAAVRVAAALAAAGLRVCAAWKRDCGDLAGRTNVQGQAARAAGATFVHLELNRSARDDPARVDRMVAELSPVLADLTVGG